jgi:hypothetical protein
MKPSPELVTKTANAIADAVIASAKRLEAAGHDHAEISEVIVECLARAASVALRTQTKGFGGLPLYLRGTQLFAEQLVTLGMPHFRSTLPTGQP